MFSGMVATTTRRPRRLQPAWYNADEESIPTWQFPPNRVLSNEPRRGLALWEWVTWTRQQAERILGLAEIQTNQVPEGYRVSAIVRQSLGLDRLRYGRNEPLCFDHTFSYSNINAYPVRDQEEFRRESIHNRFRAYVEELIRESYSEFNPQSQTYAPPLRGRTASATLYDEIWDRSNPGMATDADYARQLQETISMTANQFIGESITQSTTAHLQASITAATNRLAEEYQRTPQAYTIRKNTIRPDEITLEPGSGSGIFAWDTAANPVSVDNIHSTTDGLIRAGRRTGKSLLTDIYRNAFLNKKPPEPELPRQMDLFD